jgi:cobalt-precorrin 5A hydrolase / precorrin-3B C17-methyltransferase
MQANYGRTGATANSRVLWVGVGYKRDTSRQLIETAIRAVCRAYDLAEEAIAGVATLDAKACDGKLIDLCCDRQWQLCGFSANDLRAVTVPCPSAIVEQSVGTPSVSEAAAILAASREVRDEAFPDFQLNSLLRVPKQIFRQAGQLGAVTVAIAQADAGHSE